MAKRPSIDLIALTSEHAAPMPEAIQRMAPASPSFLAYSGTSGKGEDGEP